MQSNGKLTTKKQSEHNSFSEYESTVGGEDSIGSITSDDLSPKRSRRSSSRSSSPHTYKSIDRSKRIKAEEALKVFIYL